MSGKEAPLRHGWGGDKKARSRALQEKQAEQDEIKRHPKTDSKFGDGSSNPQEIDELFAAMLASRKTLRKL
jgi:hypothetical protein